MRRLRIPGAFCVGNDILEHFGSYVSDYGKRIVFIGGKRSIASSQSQLIRGFEKSECLYTFIESGKVASLSEIERIAAMQEVVDAQVICALGGGSCMDIARTIANRQKKWLVMIPTTVASDAPCSFVSVFYSNDGSEVVGDELYHKCPDMVYVDSKVISNAPARQIAAGMGDALATYYEATSCKNTKIGAAITETAMMISKLCREIVLRDGFAAYSAVQNHIVTTQLENVIEANCFLSGVGGANTGCAAAHGIGDYLCHVPGGHDFMHGERVYVGLIVQLILEQYSSSEIETMIRFGKHVGLPVCLGDMGIEEIDETASMLSKGLQDDHFMINLNCDYSENVLMGAFLYAQYLAETIK